MEVKPKGIWMKAPMAVRAVKRAARTMDLISACSRGAGIGLIGDAVGVFMAVFLPDFIVNQK